jgi:HAD superfamily hydrolase (TIGR01549 family)
MPENAVSTAKEQSTCPRLTRGKPSLRAGKGRISLASGRSARAKADSLFLYYSLPKLGMGGDKFVADVLGPEAGETARTVQAAHSEEYSAKGLIDHAEPLPGAVSLLRTLKERGVRTALASSAKPEEAERSLAQLGGPSTVDVLVSSADDAATKPDPDIFATALAKLGHPTRALVVGDTVYDIASARALGLPCVCVLSGGIERRVLREAGAAAIYHDAADVLAHLDAVLALAPRL